MSEDRLNALALNYFNQNVIDMFAQLKNRRAKFLFMWLKCFYAFSKIANQHNIFEFLLASPRISLDFWDKSI